MSTIPFGREKKVKTSLELVVYVLQEIDRPEIELAKFILCTMSDKQ